jgi:hypothetical protein
MGLLVSIPHLLHHGNFNQIVDGFRGSCFLFDPENRFSVPTTDLSEQRGLSGRALFCMALASILIPRISPQGSGFCPWSTTMPPLHAIRETEQANLVLRVVQMFCPTTELAALLDPASLRRDPVTG